MVAHVSRQFKISKQADAFIRSLSPKRREVVKSAVAKLMQGDFSGLNVKKLTPNQHEYRLRVGPVRILFFYAPELLFIFKAGFRGDVYK